MAGGTHGNDGIQRASEGSGARDIRADRHERTFDGLLWKQGLLRTVEALLYAAGFKNVSIEFNGNSASLVEGWSSGAGSLVVSALIRATKPVASDAAME